MSLLGNSCLGCQNIQPSRPKSTKYSISITSTESVTLYTPFEKSALVMVPKHSFNMSAVNNKEHLKPHE